MNGDPNRGRRPPVRPRPPGPPAPPGPETSDEFLVRHGLLDAAPSPWGGAPVRPGPQRTGPPPTRRPPADGRPPPRNATTQRDDPSYDRSRLRDRPGPEAWAPPPADRFRPGPLDRPPRGVPPMPPPGPRAVPDPARRPPDAAPERAASERGSVGSRTGRSVVGGNTARVRTRTDRGPDETTGRRRAAPDPEAPRRTADRPRRVGDQGDGRPRRPADTGGPRRASDANGTRRADRSTIDDGGGRRAAGRTGAEGGSSRDALDTGGRPRADQLPPGPDGRRAGPDTGGRRRAVDPDPATGRRAADARRRGVDPDGRRDAPDTGGRRRTADPDARSRSDSGGRRRTADPDPDGRDALDTGGRRRATDLNGRGRAGDEDEADTGSGRRATGRRAGAGAVPEEPTVRTGRRTPTRGRPPVEPDDEPDAGPRDPDAPERLRADRIDLTLTRLTAAHAGLSLADFAHPDDDPADLDDDEPERPPTPLTVTLGKLAVAAVALLLAVVAGLGWVGRTRLDGALRQVAAVDVAPDGVLDAAAQTGDQNVLVLATDGGGPGRATGKADTVAVVHTDAKGGRPVALTLPPDLEITRPPCERWDPSAAAYSGQTVPAEPRTTLAGAYAVGGPRCATRAAQQVTGLAITRFVATDLSATSALVEAVGGVDACVERPLLDAVLGPVVPAAGPTALNGARAAAFVRAADVRDDPAPEAGLVQRQQRVLAAVLTRALALSRLLHPGRVGRLLPALGTAVVSTGTGVDDLLVLAHALGRTDGVTLRAAPVEAAANSRGNQVLRDADAATLFAAVRTDRALPPAEANVATAAATPPDVTADVLNASGKVGLAAQVAGTLGDLGFHTAQVTNAPQAALDTVVRFSPDRAEQAQLLAAAVPSASAVPDPGTTGVLQLVLGRSFDGTVRAAATPAPVAAPTATAAAASCD